MRLITDHSQFCAQDVPKWNTISISGYHIREAGSTALQELAFTLRDGIEYVSTASRAGLDVDEFAPRLSFFFNSHNDFFEEIAKFRAARRIWAQDDARPVRRPRPALLDVRFHTQTAGCSLTAQQPYNNIVRRRSRRWPRFWAGRSRCTPTRSTRPSLCPPSRRSRIALRTQQIIAHESGVVNTIDPLGGSSSSRS